VYEFEDRLEWLFDKVFEMLLDELGPLDIKDIDQGLA
jgi:hypothetical protein